MTKTATYKGKNGHLLTLEYDPEAPCRVCRKPVKSASMGGVDLCPWCDCGVERDGKPWDLSKMLERSFADQNLVLVTNFNEATPAFPEADMDDQPMSVTRGIRSLLPSFSREDLEELADAIAKELKERNH